MVKKILIAYSSYFGNCKKAASTLAASCDEEGMETSLYPILESETLPEKPDILVLVTPVRVRKIVGPSKKFLRKIGEKDLRYALVVSHGAALDHFFSPVPATKKLERHLERKEMVRITEPLFLQVERQQGPLSKGYEKRLADLAKQLSQAVSEEDR
ncbi:flavodoxin family protein [Sediminispirochaeta smaragdinae]|uniref:Flavodoxin-like domain-containing protein n=1 Tax=Sediminispirochaeta smaragdinae (strain DSM 11293 / JCM 15392 / SEBR 4228) TaxID=573413 RepID=E1RAB0_SEDSS|nr:flavodoxin domain-containing protein [Sediminispirochaeta smaragdinae]ADK79401.1 hypothetical protein Spirs_0244 [Sediminispirochaeta smaragdinae DSM 11293]